MADLQLHIEYKNLPNKVILLCMTALFPVWAIIGPATFGLLLGQIIKNPGTFPLDTTVYTCIAIIALLLISIALTAFAEDKYVHVSKSGIAFPLLFLTRLRAGRNRNWSDITNAELIDYGDNHKSNLLALGFNSGEIVPLKIACIKKQDIEQLLLALELWGTNCKRSPQLITYQQDLQNSAHTSGGKGYTQMWEEELGRRFTNTVFIPLEPEHKLQNGRLKIIRQLAFGGLSAIYLAQLNDLDLVVLKEAVVPNQADEAKRKQAEEHLIREAKLLATIDHPNIAHVLDHFMEDGRHYLVLQYINGQDLRQFIKQHGPVSQLEAINWAIVICNILEFLHSQKPPIVHRDLTPDNLIRTNSGEIVLIDFGAANQFLGAATGTIVGKQAYIPAEQLRGNTVTQSDIYALGCTINYLLTGQDPVPLAPSHPGETIAGLNKDLDALIANCTSFEPEDRYQSASEVGLALKALLLHIPADTANTLETRIV